MMRPNPNSPSFYLLDQNDVEADSYNGNAGDVGSASSSSSSNKNATSNLHRSPPRMRSPEADGMEVDGMEFDGASNEKVSADFLRQGIKRTRQEHEGVDDQEARLSSSEPVNKKRRIQESDAQKNSSSSSATSHLHATNSPESSAATLAGSAVSVAPEADWQKKVLPSLDGCKLDEIYRDLTAEGGTARLLTFLFGEETAHWPKGEFRLIKISVIPEQMKNLLIASGAVYLCSIYEENHNFLFSSDFDLNRFRAGLLDIQNKEKNQAAEDDGDDERDKKIFTALMLAAEWGDLASVQLLLENGAIPAALNVENENALMLAAAAGHVEIVRLLLTFDIDVDALNSLRWSAFSKAAAAGQDTVCELLLEHGASLDIYTEDTHIPLHVAAKGGYTDLCEWLIQLGCDVNQLDDHEVTPLIRAAQAGHLDTCKLLLSSGANIHQDNSTGQIVLISAISSGNLELVEYLLVQGAPIEGVPNKFTPLIDATRRNYLTILKTLLKMGAGVNRTGIMGSTALGFACQNGSLEATTLLLQAGADPNLATFDKFSPLFAAACAGSVPIFNLLIQHGASFFPNQLIAHQALAEAVRGGHLEMAVLLLQAHVPVELVPFNKEADNLLIIAMGALKGDALINMLTLLLKHHIPLNRTDNEGNDALMLAVKAKNVNAMYMLLVHGAGVGQINTRGQNALHIAVDALDKTATESGLAMAGDAEILVDLLGLIQRQHNFFELHSEATIRAEHLLTREIILVYWAFQQKGLPINELVEMHISAGALLNFTQSAILASGAGLSQKTIDLGLSDAGICPPLIEVMRPYIAALPQIKFKLFGTIQGDIDKLIRIYLSGIATTLEQIRVKAGEYWTPYPSYGSNDKVFMTLNQIANIELNWLIQGGLEAESIFLTPVFETLFENCFNHGFTQPTLPATFPEYGAAAGTLAATLMKNGVYAAFATLIETAWQKAWAIFTGTPMSSDSSIASNSSSSSSSSSGATETENTIELDNGIDEQIFFGTSSAPVLSASFPDSPQGQALLKVFRDQLLLAVEETGKTILDLPKATPEDARVYAELMHRQLYMLMQFIQAK